MSAGTLYQWYQATASQRLDQPALTFVRPGGAGPITYSYEELYNRVEHIARRLSARGVNPAAPLGLLLQTQEDQVLHYLAALQAGAVPAILTPPNRKLNRQYYQDTMNAVLRRCRFDAVVSDVEGITLPTRHLRPFSFAHVPSQQPEASVTSPGDAPLDASFMQFSSGTTGIKRGVLVTDEAVMAQLSRYAQALALDDRDCILSWLPLYHDMGFIACLNMPLAYGTHTVMIDPIDWVTHPSRYLQAVSEYRATLSWHPNFAFAFMAQRARESDLAGVDLSPLRGLVNCSEPVTYESQRAFSERYAPLGLRSDVFKGCYAMAETTFALTHGDADDPQYLDSTGPTDGTRSASEAGYVSVGRPLTGVELAIVDPQDFQRLEERTVGEIWVRSPFNFSGYYNDPSATKDAFVDDWYRTGDLGYRVGDDYYVAGRLKDVLIVGGVNVFPQDIEDLVSAIEGVQSGRVSAFSAFDSRLQTEHIIILAESNHYDRARGRELTQEIRQRVLAAFQIANFEVHIVAPAWLVKSTSGKMARTANREKWLTATKPG